MKYPFEIMRETHPEDALDTFLAMKPGDFARYHHGYSLVGCWTLSRAMMKLSAGGYVNLVQVREGKPKAWHTLRKAGYYAQRTSKYARREVFERIFGGVR